MKYTMKFIDTNEVTSYKNRGEFLKELRRQVNDYYDEYAHEEHLAWFGDTPLSLREWQTNIFAEIVETIDNCGYYELGVQLYKKG